jgi:hypothetical protein
MNRYLLRCVERYWQRYDFDSSVQTPATENMHDYSTETLWNGL